jgi:hypothetical protein
MITFKRDLPNAGPEPYMVQGRQERDLENPSSILTAGFLFIGIFL